MSQPFEIVVNDYEAAERTKSGVKLGHYFVFVEDVEALTKSDGHRGRLARLLVNAGASHSRVVALVNNPVQLAGVTIQPNDRDVDPIGAVVTDRDLYRAEQDTVNLFIAAPTLDEARLIVECHGEAFTERDVQLDDGVCVEALSMLLPGSYSAQLAVGEQRLGAVATFTVAEYTLAPLSARLMHHELRKDKEQLHFDLAVESYQVPFDGKLRVALVEAGRELTSTKLKPSGKGRYTGTIRFVDGDGPFRLRLTAIDDAERIAEVTLPGSRRAERDASVVSELGREMTFSMMPEPGALPVRGGYLSEGDYLATPITVDEIVTNNRTLRINADVESLVLVCIDLASGKTRVQPVGDTAAGATVQVDGNDAMTMVFAGCMVGGHPFEGFTTFLTPSQIELGLDVPETILPRQDLVVDLRSNTKTPVLLCVRDERLTATDTPAVALGSATKRGVDAATSGMSEEGFTPLDVHIQSAMPPTFGFEEDFDTIDDIMVMESAAEPPGFDFDEEAEPTGIVLRDAEARRPEVMKSSAAAPSPAAPPRVQRSGGLLNAVAQGLGGLVDKVAEGGAGEDMLRAKSPEEQALRRGEPGELEPPRADFPEVLFYGLVPVDGHEQVLIPLGDSLGTFTIEAFTLDGGDWAHETRAVVVDQPVRVDLELPPAVHPQDRVTSRMRVASSSGRARVEVTCDGEPVLLHHQKRPLANLEVDTPYEVEIEVKPGLYRATVEDLSTGESDTVERVVNEPGKFRSHVRELGLLQPGDRITLDSADALSLRVLPGVESSFDMLVTATAGYAHLCCEQTAAKILSAVFMYLTASKAGERRQAEQIILAGIAREKKMIKPGKGFTMYPGDNYISDHYSQLAARYLWSLDQLDEAPGLSTALRQAVHEGVEMANTAAAAHRMQRLPKKIHSVEGAYAAVTGGGDKNAARAFVGGLIAVSASGVTVRDPRHVVANRATLAYAAACLIALGDLEHGIKAANEVTRQFNDEGNLYSTVDSVAAIALMIQLRVSGVLEGSGRVRVNGQELSTTEAASFSDQVESIEVLEGVAAVEVVRIHEQDWGTFEHSFPVKIGFRSSKNKKVKSFAPGDRADLWVSLPKGYEPGDLVHVALPASMAWIQGGGKVKQFTLDFEGKNELRVPVVVTSEIAGKQHFAVCVRNMFEEERATSPGLLTVAG